MFCSLHRFPVLTRLSWPKDGLIERINTRIKAQIEKIEDITGDMNPNTNFTLIVIQTELERWKYLIRSFLRARIAKIDKHTLHYLATAETRSLLSEAEVAYATRHQALLHSHYAASFLGSFPAPLQRLDDTAGGISMIDSPDVDTAVFIRVLRNCLVEGRGRDADDEMDARAGEVLVARWSDVKKLVVRGDAELV